MFAWLRQRRWQFSISFLMGVVLVTAVGAAMYGNHLRAIQRQEKAFEKLATRGYSVLVYEEGAYVQSGNLSGLMCGTGLERVIEASSSVDSLTDDDIAVFGDIRKLRSVSGSQLTPEAIALIKRTHPDCHFD